MRYLRVLSLAFLSFVFALVAGTAGAQSVKKFSLGAPTTLVASQTTLKVTFTNLEGGSASFNSASVTGVASGGATLLISDAVVTSSHGPGSVSVSNNIVTLTNLAPVKKNGPPLEVELTVAMSADGCAGGTITWSGLAWTGSPSSPSNVFQPSSAKSGLFGADCVLGCVNDSDDPPLDALSMPNAGTGVIPPDDSAPDVGDTGYVAGARGLGDFKGSMSCTQINYSLTNNIPLGETVARSDPSGNNVPVGFYSFTFAVGAAINPVVAITTTFRPELGSTGTGLPTKKTVYCSDTPCTSGPTYVGGVVQLPWKVVQACHDTVVTHASIPDDEGACLAAETFRVVPASQCGATFPQRCVQVTAIQIIGVDPVFGR